MAILFQVIMILLNAVFACAEIAVISVNENRLAQLVESGDKRAIRLSKLTSNSARFLATIQVAITLAGYLGSAFAADNFSDKLVDWLISIGLTSIPRSTLNSIAVVLITIILAYFTLIFGELVPKRLAMKKAEKLALGMATPINFISKLFAPIVWFLTISTNLVLRLLKIDPNSEDNSISEEEIRMMVDAGSKKGVIDVEENQMIQNVFEFNDLEVGEFATHRTDVTLLKMDDSLEEWEQTIYEEPHTMYPVCGENIDDVIGILNATEYFRLKDKTKENILKNAVHPAYFIPETLRADVLFRQMKQSKNRFAVLLDEYGGMVGIVTMSDLVEQLLGDLDFENSSDKDGPEIEKIDDNTWKIRGITSLDDVEDALDVALPVDEYDTFGGFVFGLNGSIPKDGSKLELDYNSLHIRALEIKEHRLEVAVVTKIST